jgi:hypothetical protein
MAEVRSLRYFRSKDPLEPPESEPEPLSLPRARLASASARARIDGDTVRPSALAVLRLTTSSKVVGCCTGRSAGLAPLRIRCRSLLKVSRRISSCASCLDQLYDFIITDS